MCNRMIEINSIETFSGLFLFLALVALLNRWLTLAGILLTVTGAAGFGVFWERWSRLTGHEVQIQALWDPVRPTDGQIWLFATHMTMLVMGLALLSWLAARREGSGGQ
ncbi:MAG: hypothetical protein ACREMU_11725 [Gemmatimonadaceae bacterium]